MRLRGPAAAGLRPRPRRSANGDATAAVRRPVLLPPAPPPVAAAGQLPSAWACGGGGGSSATAIHAFRAPGPAAATEPWWLAAAASTTSPVLPCIASPPRDLDALVLPGCAPAPVVVPERSKPSSWAARRDEVDDPVLGIEASRSLTRSCKLRPFFCSFSPLPRSRQRQGAVRRAQFVGGSKISPRSPVDCLSEGLAVPRRERRSRRNCIHLRVVPDAVDLVRRCADATAGRMARAVMAGNARLRSRAPSQDQRGSRQTGELPDRPAAAIPRAPPRAHGRSISPTPPFDVEVRRSCRPMPRTGPTCSTS